MRTRCSSRRPCRISSWPAANGIRCVKPSSATQAPSRHVPRDRIAQGRNCGHSLHHGARLLAQVERQVVDDAIALPVEPEPFQPPKGW